MNQVAFEPRERVRVGFVGLGGRGRYLLGEALACEGVEMIALADANESALAQSMEIVTKVGQPAPRTYLGVDGWRKMCDLDLDLVLIATPWRTHTEISVAMMESGKHVGVEVPATISLEECWQLVETSERTRRHCVMIENCCYDYWEMLIKNMVNDGRLGTITHAECAYIHEMRAMLLSAHGEGLWRREGHMARNGNLYPTHGLGPVAQILGIGKEDSFDYLVSMSSKSVGLTEFRDMHFPDGDPKLAEIYRCGDMNSSLIRTKLGRTILLQHDVVTPRPYDRNLLIGGTKGTFRNYPPRIFLDSPASHEESLSIDAHDWQPLDSYKERYEDPLWKMVNNIVHDREGGHGGMDFLVLYRLIQAMRNGEAPDMDVYDAAEWSAPGPLSEMSVAKRSAPIDFPNFRKNS